MKCILVVALLSRVCFAWESVCSHASDPTAEVDLLLHSKLTACATPGPATARERWVGPLDEHRQLWERARRLAGLPAALSQTLAFTVFTQPQSVQPVEFADASAVTTRHVSLGELAELPDFSYSLTDWVTGNETCPLDGALDAVACHTFASHMGPANSNHFLPQAQVSYAQGHRLALERAAKCQDLATRFGSHAQELGEYLLACEDEALALEAVAQHFLQDAWSVGHMWERWGSPNLFDFPGDGSEAKRDRAALVALVSGLIHGARGVLQVLPAWTTFDVDDAMCAPDDGVHFVSAQTEGAGAVGDDYLAQFLADARYSTQRRQLDDCATSGLLEVYRAAGAWHGPAAPDGTLHSVDPVGAECFGQRVTNQAMARGIGLDFELFGVQHRVPLTARIASWALPLLARGGSQVEVSGGLLQRFRLDLERIATMAKVRAKASPMTTELATGGLGSFVGVPTNGSFIESQPAYADTFSPVDGEGPLALRRFFHRAHVDEWCEATTMDTLLAMRTHVASTEGEAQVAACAACVELVRRHLVVNGEIPVCGVLSFAAPLLNSPEGESAHPATAWCGCAGS